MTYTAKFIGDATRVLQQLDQKSIGRVLDLLLEIKANNGRIFFLGVGGGAANASHAVNDFRKIAEIESYAPTDNVSEMTARVNDDGWESSFANWLRGSHLNPHDMVFVFSVGGGNLQRNISANLVRALQYAKEVGAKICAVIGRDGGFTAQVADAFVLIPVVDPEAEPPTPNPFKRWSGTCSFQIHV